MRLRPHLLAAVAILSVVLVASATAAEPRALLYAFNAGTKKVWIIDMQTQAVVATKLLGAAVRWLSNEQDFYDGRLVWTYEDRNDGKVDALAIDLQAAKVVKRIRLGTGPGFSVVLTSDRGFALADVAGDDKIAVIDTKTFKVARYISSGKYPCDLDRTSDGEFAYVPEREQDTVAMIDLRTFRIVKRYDMGKHTEPHMLRVAPDNKTVWIANAEENALAILDASTLKLVTKIPMGKVPVTLAFTPDGLFAYVSHFSDNFVSVVDTRTLKEAGRIKVAQGLAVVGFRPDGKFAYVAAMDANAVAVIDTAARKVVKMIPAGRQPWGLLVFPPPLGR
jgi:YVTN family beta-propeller protein